MRLNKILLLAAGIVLGSAAGLTAAEPNIGELTGELKGEREPVQRTQKQLEAVYVQVLDSLMPDMSNAEASRRQRPQDTLERIAFRAGAPGAEAHRLACAKAIAARLGPAGGTLGRVWLLRQLERIGRAEVVGRLAELLGDKDAHVRESARKALQKNPSQQANAALQKALAAARKTPSRVAMIQALSDRKDPANLNSLTGQAGDDNDDIRSAAVIGLAKLGDKGGVAAVQAAMTKGSPAARRSAANCFGRLADALAAAGDKAAALGMYKKMLSAEGHFRCAGLIGIGRAGGTGELPTILAAADNPDIRTRGACVEALCLLKGAGVADALAARVPAAKPPAKVALLTALARRGETGARSVFLAAAQSADEAVAVAALTGLGKVGDPAAVTLLLKIAATAGKRQDAARRSLLTLRDSGVNRALLAAMASQDAKVRGEVVRALSARQVKTATPALLKAAAGDADAGVRSEAVKAVGAVGDAKALAPLAALLVKASDDGSRNEAANALIKIANRQDDVEGRSAPILKALAGATGPARLALLGVLGRIGGTRSLQAVRAAVKGSDANVTDAAIRALAEWPDAAAADDLLAIAKGAGDEKHQIIALRGYLRIARDRRKLNDAQRAKLLAAGLAAAKRTDEKRRALGGLREARDLVALQAVVPCMDDKALQKEAASAAARLGRDLAGRHPKEVKAAMQKVLAVTKDDRVTRDARDALDRAERRLKELQSRKK